ncbi:MAG: ComF family protein [Muribaculaceae bacterium]|nr:ComF family protein [Muribaculaceae bacterium]
MPKFHAASIVNNELHQTLAMTKPVDRAGALFYYHRESPFTRLIHGAKYNDLPQLARLLGEQLGLYYLNTGFFDDIDALIPVPISTFKKIRRGYNQSLMIAQGISKISGIKIMDCLKSRPHSTQTRKNARYRFENARGVYSVKKSGETLLSKKQLGRPLHVILVDDVVTTGATMLQCIKSLREIEPSINISVLAPAATKIS